MAVREFRLVFLLVFVFLLSGDLLSVEARTSNKKPGVCPKHEDGTEWCGESPDGIYASVHRTSAQEESGTPVKSDNEKRTSTDIKPSSAGTDQSEGTVREHGSPAGLASGKSDGGEQGETNSAESHSREDVHTETAGMGQSADRETAGTASEDKEPEPELRVPFVSGVKVGHIQKVEILPGIEREMKTLSMRPLVFEIPDFLDPMECDFISAMAQRKGMRSNPKWTNNRGVFLGTDSESTFKNWDFNGDDILDPGEIVILPGKTDLPFSEKDALEMFKALSMDQDENGKIDLQEFKSVNVSEVKEYFEERLQDTERRRNATSETAWLWHDEDELLRYEEDVLQGFHERLQAVTQIPEEVVEESEPVQVSHFKNGSYHYCQQDSEPFFKKVPCCLYGDMKGCRLCRTISMVYFLNDVEEGGELVFPLANNQRFEDDIRKNSGYWTGFFEYDKTTGSKNKFHVNMTFTAEGEGTVVLGNGEDEGGKFELSNGSVSGDIIRFQKRYNTDGDLSVKYAARLKEHAQMGGRWWVPGHPRMRGSFYMSNQDYEEWTRKHLQRCNTKAYCAKTGLVVKPAKGKAVMWYNHVPSDDGRWVESLDRRSYYGLCDVTKGERWLAAQWINIIGDGNSRFKAWRSGRSWVGQKRRAAYPNIYDRMARRKDSEVPDIIEEEISRDMEERSEPSPAGPPERHVLGAVSMLLNALDDEGLRAVSMHVHQKLQLMCVPLVFNRGGKVSVVDGSKE